MQILYMQLTVTCQTTPCSPLWSKSNSTPAGSCLQGMPVCESTLYGLCPMPRWAYDMGFQKLLTSAMGAHHLQTMVC